MDAFPYPSAFMVPIWVQLFLHHSCHRGKTDQSRYKEEYHRGETFPMFFSRSALSPKSEYSGRSLRSEMIHSGVSISSTSFWASLDLLLASAILSSASFFAVLDILSFHRKAFLASSRSFLASFNFCSFSRISFSPSRSFCSFASSSA